MKIKFENVLVLAPHTDDGELGAGGTISKFIQEGSNVDYVAFSACEESVPAGFAKDVLRSEVLFATEKLGIKSENVSVLDYRVRYFKRDRQAILEDLIRIRRNKKYELVLIPSTTDVHQDHSAIAEEAIRAFKGTNIWGYELIWNCLESSSDCFVQLSAEDVQRKCFAMAEYKSQSGRSYVSEKFISALAHVRGVQVGFDYAECFEVIRTVIK